MLPDRVTPVGTAEPKLPPFRLYVQFEIAVFTAVPVTAKLEAGVIFPSLSTVIACVAPDKEMSGAESPLGPCPPCGPMNGVHGL